MSKIIEDKEPIIISRVNLPQFKDGEEIKYTQSELNHRLEEVKNEIYSEFGIERHTLYKTMRTKKLIVLEPIGKLQQLEKGK